MHRPLSVSAPAARPGALGLTARAGAVAALSALLGGSLAPAPTPVAAPAPTEEPAPLAPAVTAASTAGPAGAFRSVDDENVVTGADATAVPVDGVEADPQTAARGDVAPEELAALTSAEDTRRFMGLGVTWDAGEDDVLSVSVRLREGGAWTEWNTLQLIGEDAGAATARTGTEPLLTDGADGYQVQVVTASGQSPAGLQVNLVDPGVGTLDATVADRAQEAADTPTATLAAARTDAATGEALPAARRVSAASDRLMPTIVRRSAWGADECIGYRAPQNPRLSAMYLHHTASSNAYTRQTAAAQLRTIQHYQAVTLGWGDIGYHILVDKFGTIYEGARGSLDSLPVGAHALGFNRDTFAVSALGNYAEAAPTPEMVDAITRVVAWKAAAYGLDPLGQVTLTSGGNSKNARGTRVTGPAVMGHFYTNNTECPGANLVPRLPEIRRNAAALIARAGAATGPFVTPDRTSATAPAPAPAPSTAPAGAAYTVRPNDGWWIISRRTGVAAATLQRLNGLTASSVIHPGQVLRTSSGAAPAHAAEGVTRTVTGWPLVNLRAGASTGTPVVARIKETTRVTLTRVSDDGRWGYITHPLFEGWMAVEYLN